MSGEAHESSSAARNTICPSVKPVDLTVHSVSEHRLLSTSQAVLHRHFRLPFALCAHRQSNLLRARRSLADDHDTRPDPRYR